MKERKQYIGKPPVHTFIEDIGTRIHKLERAGMTLPTRINRIYGTQPKIQPTPGPGPTTPPQQAPVPTTESVLYMVLVRQQIVDFEFVYTTLLFRLGSDGWEEIGEISIGDTQFSASGGIRQQDDVSLATLLNQDGSNWATWRNSDIEDPTWDLILGVYPEDPDFVSIITQVARDADGNYWGVQGEPVDYHTQIVYSTDGLSWSVKYDSDSAYIFSISCHPSDANVIIAYGQIDGIATAIVSIDGNTFTEVPFDTAAQAGFDNGFLIKFILDGTAYILYAADSQNDNPGNFLDGTQYIRVASAVPPYTSWSLTTLESFNRLYNWFPSILSFSPNLRNKVFATYQIAEGREQRTIVIDIALGGSGPPDPGSSFTINGTTYTYVGTGAQTGTNITTHPSNWKDDTYRAVIENMPSPFTTYGTFFNGAYPPFFGISYDTYGDDFPAISSSGFSETVLGGGGEFIGIGVGYFTYHFDGPDLVMDTFVFDTASYTPRAQFGYVEGYQTGPVNAVSVGDVKYLNEGVWESIGLPFSLPDVVDGYSHTPPHIKSIVYKQSTDTLYIHFVDAEYNHKVYSKRPAAEGTWIEVSGDILESGELIAASLQCMWEIVL